MNIGALLPDLCELCELQLQPGQTLLCGHCQAALPPAVQQLAPLASADAEDLLLTPLAYADSVRFLIGALKFHHNRRAARILARTMLPLVRTAYGDAPPPLLLPVPMSWRARVRRGYNQAEWLAHELARELPARSRTRLLRKRHGVSQRSKTRAERLALRQSSFVVRAAIPVTHVAIVDDVYTTGATVRTLRAVLRRAGVARIDAWCVARA
ncbi:MAG: ComF family protein [Pseudomonadota bacterium]